MALAKGTSQLGVGIATELFDEVKAFAEGRGQTLRHVVERALRRHLDSPPPIVTEPPLPPAPPEVVKSASKKPTKGKAK